MKTLWALTHISRDGFRLFTHSNTGRNHHATKEQAERSLASTLANNSPDRLRQIFGPHFAETARVDWVECYDHGDRMGGGRSSIGQLYFPERDVTREASQREAVARVINGGAK